MLNALGQLGFRREQFDPAFEEKHPREKDGKFEHGGADPYGHVQVDHSDSTHDKYGNPIPRDTATAEQRGAVYNYGQFSYDRVNDAFRGGRAFKGDAAAEGKHLSGQVRAAFDNPKIYRETANAMTVHRGIDSEAVYRSFAHMKVGGIVGDKAPLSTSRAIGVAIHHAGDRDTAFNHVLVHLDIPKGQRYISGRTDEREMILPPGTRFRITQLDVTRAHREGNRMAAGRATVHGKVLR